jgi:hypothetical protein
MALDVPQEDVAHRDVDQVEEFTEQRCLGALARAAWTHDDKFIHNIPSRSPSLKTLGERPHTAGAPQFVLLRRHYGGPSRRKQ